MTKSAVLQLLFAATLLVEISDQTMALDSTTSGAAKWSLPDWFLQQFVETPSIPSPYGVNIHIHTRPRDGEIAMLAASGVKWVRMDLSWDATELQKGVYNFTDYDLLMTVLTRYDLGMIFILDYANPLYDDGLSPHTEEAFAAFSNWAFNAASNFLNLRIMYEIYNEPNIGFWKPKPNVQDYVKFALFVSAFLKEHVEPIVLIGPATSRVDFQFIEQCIGAGLLTYWDAVSVHPYRDTDPEDAAIDFANLRKLINASEPAGKVAMPIISSEWGYSTRYHGFDVDRQAKSLARMWLSNIMNNISLSIWYDWQNDGTNQTYVEDHFGMVYNKFYPGRTPVHDPKPAYYAAKTLTTILHGLKFEQRLPVMSSIGNKSELYALVFSAPEITVRRKTYSSVEPEHGVASQDRRNGDTASVERQHGAGQAAGRDQAVSGDVVRGDHDVSNDDVEGNHDVGSDDEAGAPWPIQRNLVAWCSNATLIPCQMTVRFGEPKACYVLVDYTGQELPQLCADVNSELTFSADTGPLYFIDAQTYPEQNSTARGRR
eukprot:scpid69412/ scgid3109/ 